MNEEHLLETAYLIRRTESALLRLFTEGRLHGTIHTCLGQELVAPCLSPHLREKDYVFSNHRGHGHYLAITGDLSGLLGELLGRASGAVGGIGGSQHLQRGNFFSNGVQGGIVPLTAGSAWSSRLAGTGAISVAFIGDGTLGEGVLYETMNLASRWGLPMLLVLEDNRYAQSTPSEETFAGDLKLRAKGFGFDYSRSTTADPAALYSVFERAVGSLRSGGGPCLVHVDTFRLAPHSTKDDFRDPAEIEAHRMRDFLTVSLSRGDRKALDADAKAEQKLQKALEQALAQPPAARAKRRARAPRSWSADSALGGEGRHREALGAALGALLAQPGAVFLGEDISDPYGGCFKISAGLSSRHGDRVRNAPISEAAIAGVATGAALAGRTGIAELMFGDFSLLAMDQIVNHAAKFAEMYPARVPRVIFRAPMGGGRGYGPTHSQNLEKHFLGVPGLEVLSHNAFTPPAKIFDAVAGPAFLVEHKLLYAENQVSALPAPWRAWREKASLDVWLEPDGIPPVVILAGHGFYSGILWEAARRLLQDHEIAAAVFVKTRLSGYDAAEDRDRWERAPQRLAFEEGNGYGSFSAELGAQLSELGLSLRRWAPPHEATPSAPSLETAHRLTPELVIVETLEALA